MITISDVSKSLVTAVVEISISPVESGKTSVGANVEFDDVELVDKVILKKTVVNTHNLGIVAKNKSIIFFLFSSVINFHMFFSLTEVKSRLVAKYFSDVKYIYLRFYNFDPNLFYPAGSNRFDILYKGYKYMC